MRDTAHKILLTLTALTIVGEVASIILWIVNPTLPPGQARFTLVVDYTVAVANAAVFSVLNIIAFVLIFRRNKWGPLFLIAISVANRVVSSTFFIGGAHLIFISWAALLIIFALLDYRKLRKQK
jgi:hypothetical protein